uniref:Uncharacterized protein n=1 Tax=Aegilops tauschii subsp. strangulata TaxID=200361 RepID=A0A452YDE1_AEGTS
MPPQSLPQWKPLEDTRSRPAARVRNRRHERLPHFRPTVALDHLPLQPPGISALVSRAGVKKFRGPGASNTEGPVHGQKSGFLFSNSNQHEQSECLTQRCRRMTFTQDLAFTNK